MADDWQTVLNWMKECGERVLSFEAMAGDLSQRRYARVRVAGGSFVVAHYPTAIVGTCARFALTTGLLERAGVRVPRVIHSDAGRGLMLLEDFGPRTLHDAAGRPWDELTSAYRTALRIIERIQRLDAVRCDALSPRLDADLMRRELDQTRRLFLEPWVETSDPGLDRLAQAALDRLCADLESDAELVPCHRDFMARNLVEIDGDLGVLDHQDLRLGPRAYDLASLLNDSLFPPSALEDELLARAGIDRVGRRHYDRAVVQRTLKAVGTYSLFASRGQLRHVALIVPSIERAVAAMTRLPEMSALASRWGGALTEGARKLSATLISA